MVIALALCALAAGAPVDYEYIDVGGAWAAHPLPFALLTRGEQQYVGYYDTRAELTIAARKLGETHWQYERLGENPGADSHRGVAMALDSAGQLHVAANMHVSPLVYFRTETPGDISTLKRRSAMVGTEELEMTYPEFFHDHDGTMLFFYRNGKSGQGNDVLNRYHPDRQLWQRVTFKPISLGGGERSAYFDKFQRGPDGSWHVAWVWRERGEAESTNTLCYARTKDFRQWTNIHGEKLNLPLRKDSPAVVDPVPPGGGLLNGNAKLGFTADGRPVIAYHKHDEQGTQIFAAGWDGQQWVISKLTSYDYRWDFKGRGTLVGEIGIRRPQPDGEGQVSIQWRHARLGTHRRLVDAATFAPGELVTPLHDGVPQELRDIAPATPGMVPRFVRDAGEGISPDWDWVLRWEAWPANNDKAREGSPVNTSLLRVYRVPEARIGD